MAIPMWKLNDLTKQPLRTQLDRLDDFVDKLRLEGIDVPACWYTHGWLRRRLAILMAWHFGAVEPNDGNRWWVELFALIATPHWHDAISHAGQHVDPATHERIPIPSFDEVTASLVEKANDPDQ